MNTEVKVAKTDELGDGQMKEISVGEQSILLVRLGGQYRAFWPRCPHQGARLAEGVLHEGHIRCPWHQAVFDAVGGEPTQPPALETLRHYETRVEGDEVIVTIPDTVPPERPAPLAKPDPSADGRTFVIVGAGAAGAVAAETLRQDGFRGRIVMLTREAHPFYDRTELSKFYLSKPGADPPVLRSAAFYEDHGIELRTGTEVTEADPQAGEVVCADGTRVAYDKLLLATGGAPRRLGAAGEDLENVFPLRSLDDCQRVRSAAEGASNVVVVGGSFIAMEVAAALAQRKLPVTVVAPESVPLERVFGERIGRMYRKVHEDKGVTFRLGAKVERFEGDGKLSAVVLEDGGRIEAGLAVVGAGVRPVTDYLKGVDKNADGSVTVDSRLRLGENVYAAGDIACFPDWRSGEPIRIEHWRLAQQHGRVAGHNMAGRDVPFRDVPFFWTDQYMVITDYVGCARRWDDVVFDGDPDEQSFVAYYLREGKVRAAAACARDRTLAAVGEVLRGSSEPALDELRRSVDRIVQPPQNA